MAGVSAPPVGRTSFVGRHTELREVRNLLARSRLVTLTGTGGVGKTRLAWRTAEQVRRSYPDGVYLVQLAPLRSPALLTRTVCGAFGLLEDHEEPVARLADFLEHKRVLLVLDNCEHMAGPCADLVDALLGMVPELRVLATSRRLLGVDGEHVFDVPPLTVPEVADLDAAVDLDAVALFADRAAAAARFDIDEANWSEVVRICRRLDGLPLAIELAAVWLRTQTVGQIAEHLVGEVGKGLAVTISRSYTLCSPQQRLLWARAAVFEGGFDLRAAEKVCSGDGIDRSEVLGLVAGLVHSSVLRPDREGTKVRYRILDTIRQYGLDLLPDAGAVHLRHRDYYLRLAEEVEREWPSGSAQPELAAKMLAEHANLRAALEFSLTTHGQHAIGLRLAGALRNFWLNCGRLAEGLHWLGWALRLNPEPSQDRAQALWVMANALLWAGDPRSAALLATECLDWASKTGADRDLGYARFVGGGSSVLTGDLHGGLAQLREAISLLHEPEDTSSAITARSVSAICHAWLGELETAERFADEALQMCDARGELWCRSEATCGKALVQWFRGEYEQAKLDLRAGLLVAWQFRDVMKAAMLVELMAWALAANGESARAAEVFGVAHQMWPLVGGNPMLGSPLWIQRHEACVTVTKDALGAGRFATGFDRGATKARDFDSAMKALFGEPAAVKPARPLLSERERQVANLVAEGLTNREIATRLTISQRTVAAHVDHVLTKLGFTSRTQIATWVVSQR